MSIEILNITKRFGAFAALDDISISVMPGEFLALLGPSGSGKTTLLRIIAGLEFPDQGSIRLASEDVLHRSTRDRGVGFVFQHYALFRHMTVFENVAFGLRVKPRGERLSKAQIAERVHELLRLVQLDHLSSRFPSQLSGGQRQRIALARALAVQPKIVMLDEPFGALDAKVRRELRRWLRNLHDQMGLTSVFVTHDQEEALELADRVVVMNHGRVEQIGPPQEVYDRPGSPFVYEFLGNSNRIACRIADGWAWFEGSPISEMDRNSVTEGSAIAFIRPHELDLEPSTASTGVPATVRQIFSTGPLIRVELETSRDRQMLDAEIPRLKETVLALRPGSQVRVVPKRVRIFADGAAEPVPVLDQVGEAPAA